MPLVDTRHEGCAVFRLYLLFMIGYFSSTWSATTNNNVEDVVVKQQKPDKQEDVSQ